jgi:hypothetical protein
VARSAARGSGRPNGHQWTPQSHLEAHADHRVFAGPPRRTDPRDVRFADNAELYVLPTAKRRLPN